MKQIKAASPKPGRMDFVLFTAVLVLCAFGLIMVLSASYYYSYQEHGDGLYYFVKQIVFFVLGLAAMLILAYLVPYKTYKLPPVIASALLITLGAMIYAYFFGVEVNGARRWINLGFATVQPSELAKFVLVIFMSAYLTSYRGKIRTFKHGVLLPTLMLAPFAVVVMLQSNMSMLLIMIIVFVIMLFIGEVRPIHIAFLGAVALLAILPLALDEDSFRLARITTFLDPWQDPSGNGYQLIQSYFALGAGGLFGRGLNLSRQKLLFLTYGESDFIFAIIGEELGWVGCVLLLALYGLVIYRGFKIAFSVKDRFASLLAGGITSIIAIQAAVHVLVTTGRAPTTGQTLPFVSAGGTSLIFFMAAMGILLNISRYVEKRQIHAKATSASSQTHLMAVK